LFWCVMANTVKSMGEVLPPKRSRAEKNRAAQDDDSDYGFDDATAGDDDDETGRDLFYETPEAMYVKRAPLPALPSEDSDDDDDDANDPYDDDDDDDEGWRDEDSDDEPAPGYADDPDYDDTPKVGDSNGPVIS
jgi:segregation and condensation protein B